MKQTLITLFLFLLPSLAFAQSSADRSIIGSLTTAGCSGSTVPCFVPFGPLALNASSVAGTSAIIKASGGQLYGISVTSTSAGTLQLYNQTTVPSAGTVSPVACYTVAANTTVNVPFNTTPALFSTGIVATFSSAVSCFTYTASSTALISYQYQ